jgi:dipeptidyl aminopeptidase/acylaminoacyl peptidase
MRDDDLLSFVWIADPQISPDGRMVAFTRVWVDREADEYRTQIWWVEVDGGDPRPLTNGGWDAQPRWSPDGTRIAFVRRTDREKPAQIHVLRTDGGEAVALTSLEKGVGSPAWSPDGTRIAFTSGTNPELDDPKREKPKHEPGRIVTRPVFRENNAGFLIDFDHLDHVWVIAADGGDPRPLTRGTAADGPPRWSRDGRRVRFVADRRAEPWFGHEESVLYAVDPERGTPADTAELETVIEYPGPVRAFAEGAGGFAVIGTPHRDSFASYQQMDVLQFAPGSRTPRTLNASRAHAFGEGVSSDQHPPRGGGESPFGFAPDGSVVTLAARSGAAMLVRVDANSGAVTELTPADRDIVVGTGTPDGRRWAFTIGSVTSPGDLAVLDVASASLRTLYAPNHELLSGIALGRVEEFRYPSFDGQEIQGWIVHPIGATGAVAPTILEIHGGPHTAYGYGFFHEFHRLAGAGYRVVYTNPRGSTSYGESFADCIQYRYPGDDVGDLLAAIDVLVARGLADPARLGITGGSGGGLLTNWIIAKDPRFQAAVTQRCVSDWANMASSCDFPFFTPFWFRSQPWQDPAEWIERSPLSLAAGIQTPLMVIHSEEDWRTPIAQGEAMFRALLQQRKPAVMIRFPGENHELSRSGTPSRRVQNQQHIGAWFDRWLLGTPAPQYGF